MKLRYQYRIYPTTNQQNKLAKLFGCCRVVWNDALAFIKSTPEGEKWASNAELQKIYITQAKRTSERAWLSNVSNIPLQQSIQDLGVAFKNFFESRSGKRKGQQVRFPRFKKRSHEQSARFRKGGFSVKSNKVYLAKIGRLKVKWSRPLPSEASSVTVLKNAAGQYHLSFVVEVEPPIVKPKQSSIGIDLGIKTFAVTSQGEYVQSPGYDRLERKIRRFQRKLSRQVKGSSRWHQTRLRIAKLHLKIANIRKDFLHQLSTRIVHENQVVVLEDLNVSGMVKNRRLTRAISKQGWRQFRTMCEAKSGLYSRECRTISRWEATSQTCSSCGYRWGKINLSVRTVTCVSCQTVHDRDENAALNIERSGTELSQDRQINGCGVSVRPQLGAVCDEAPTRLVVEQINLFAS